MEKKLYLHIGSPKTGTTSLQMRLFQNSKTLADQGFCYPGKEFSHQKIFFSTGCSPKDWARQFRGQNHQAVMKVVNNYMESFEKDLKTDFRNYIVSSEDLFITNESYIQNLLNYLNHFFDEVIVIAVIRDPIDYYRSYQQELIKARSYIESPYHFKYNIKKVVETWAAFADTTIIRFMPGEDIFDSFCDLTGLKSNRFVKRPNNNNSSMSIEQILLLEKVQKHLYKEKDDMLKVHLKAISNINAPFGSKVKLQDWVKPVIYQNHKEDIDWLFTKYGIDFRNSSYVDESAKNFSSDRKSEVREIYRVEEPRLAEKYEALIVDGLLRKLVS